MQNDHHEQMARPLRNSGRRFSIHDATRRRRVFLLEWMERAEQTRRLK